MTASKPSSASKLQEDERLRLLMEEIDEEQVPERMVELARKLQTALDERDGSKITH